MQTLYMTLGVPGSGKSFWAAHKQQLLKEIGETAVIVNKDDIRNALAESGWRWSHKNETDVIFRRDQQIINALKAGHSVISSDCNFGNHQNRLEHIAKQMKVKFEVVDLTGVDLELCIGRDNSRIGAAQVGEKVIREMYEKYVGEAKEPSKDTPIQTYIASPDKPKAIICDLDGTLALFKGKRGPFEYHKVANDDVNKPVAEIVKWAGLNGYHIVYLSGRESVCYDATKEWLYNKGLPRGPLFMRQTKDYRKDNVVKLELFNEHIRDHYNVAFCLDDRDQVVKLWRGLGLTCLQVADGSF